MDRGTLLASPFGPAIQAALARRDELRRKVEEYKASAIANRTNQKVRLYAQALKHLEKAELQLRNVVALAIQSIKVLEAKQSQELRNLLRQQERVSSVMARPLGREPTNEEMANALRGVDDVEAALANTGPAAAGAGPAPAVPAPAPSVPALPVPGSAASYAAPPAPAPAEKNCKPGNTGVGCSIMGGKLRRHRRRSLRKTSSHGHKRSLRRHLTRRR